MLSQFVRKRLPVRSDALCSLWILTMLIASLSLLVLFLGRSAYAEKDPIVKLPNGNLVGFKQNIFNKPLYTYLGIPYALPANEFRFREAQLDDRTWPEERSAKTYGPGCPNPDLYIKFQNGDQNGSRIEYSEDCLQLNVWSPVHFNRTHPMNEKQLKPVFVFLHGGALLFNSAVEEKYFDGRILASLGDLVVVTLNYRLGILGFLYDGNEIKGNLGLLDQRLALEWVHKNIKQFGGDPNKITLAGESAGSWSVGIHLLLEKKENERQLFHNAIMMSGAPLPPVLEESEATALKKFQVVSKRTKCTNLECLQKTPLKELMVLHHDQEIIGLNKNSYRLAFQPVYGPQNGLGLDKSTFEQLMDRNHHVRNISLLIGNLVNEGQDAWTLWKFTFNDPIKEPLKSKAEYIEALRNFVSTTVDLSHKEIDALVANIDKFYYNDEALNKLKDDEELVESFQYSLRSSFYEILSDLVFICPSKFFAKSYFHKIQTERVYEYEISYESLSPGTKSFAPWCEENKYGPCHMLDLQYVFGRPFKVISKYSTSDRALSYDVMKLISHFANTGKATWKSYFQMDVKKSHQFTVPTEFELNPNTGNEELIGMEYLSCTMFEKYFYTKN